MFHAGFNTKAWSYLLLELINLADMPKHWINKPIQATKYPYKELKDAMPVSFWSDLLTSYIFTIFNKWNLLPLIWENAKYSYFYVKILQKN